MKFPSKTVGALLASAIALFAGIGRMVVSGLAVVLVGALFGGIVSLLLGNISFVTGWPLWEIGAFVSFVSHVWSAAK